MQLSATTLNPKTNYSYISQSRSSASNPDRFETSSDANSEVGADWKQLVKKECQEILLGPVAAGLGWVGESLGMSLASPFKIPFDENPLKQKAPVRLEKPLIMVPGFNTRSGRFDQLFEKLKEVPENGQVVYLKEGRAYRDRDGQQPLENPADWSQDRMFEMIFEPKNSPPDVTSPQIRANLEAVRQATGQSQLDVAAYSMGGLATRRYLDQGGDAIGRLMLVASPQHGSELAWLSLELLNAKEQRGWNTQFFLDAKPIRPEDRGALTWLSTGPGASDNPLLKDLNSRWPMQKQRVTQVMGVVSDVRRTVDLGWSFGKGDGSVSTTSASLPGLELKHVQPEGELAKHRWICSSPEVFDEMQGFFGWKNETPSEAGA